MRRLVRSFLVLVLFTPVISVLPATASAQACNFEVDGFNALPDRVALQVMRCLVVELDRLRRENAALKGRIARIEALMTELPAAYANADGVVTEDEGRAIGRASFLLTARSTGGANVLALEQRVLEEVCGRKGGCAVSLAFRRISLVDRESQDSVLTGPCQFTYDTVDGDWTLGTGCGATPSSGTDGDQSAVGEDAADPVLVQSGGACLLSESEPGRVVGRDDVFQRDHGRGLFLIAMPSRQPDGIRRFQCELVLN